MNLLRYLAKLRSLFLLLGAVLAGCLVVLAVLLILLRHEPRWYALAEQKPGPERQRLSGMCMSACAELVSVCEDKEWSGELTDEGLNAFFEEGFRTSRVGRDLPTTLDRPRVAFEQDLVRVGFRYGRQGLGNAVVTLDLRLWVSAQEPGCIMAELAAFHIGALPVSVQTVLETMADAAREQKIDVNWYRNPATGRPVAVLRFQSDKTRPTIAFRGLQVTPGKLNITGGDRPGP